MGFNVLTPCRIIQNHEFQSLLSIIMPLSTTTKNITTKSINHFKCRIVIKSQFDLPFLTWFYGSVIITCQFMSA
jgi:hypothetical protein